MQKIGDESIRRSGLESALHFRARDQLWTLLEACYLLAGKLPPVADPVFLMIAPPAADEELQFSELAGDVSIWYRELRDAVALRRLESLPSTNSKYENPRVEPAKCVAWARSRNQKLPKFLDRFETPTPKAHAADLNPKDKTSLLALVIAMAIHGYEYDPREKRGEKVKEILGDVAYCGLEMTDDTVRKWLKEAAKLVDAETLEKLLRSKKA